MKLVVSTDWHGDWSTLGVRRHYEVALAVDASVDAAIAEHGEADVVVLTPIPPITALPGAQTERTA